ncbi:hypothetical protein L484_009287 [Morus notabilis]|uniref:Uncharacterized protein n=1 Tax=Morus notabilis TaxID=981085 RepID=W9R973_9ROSA|nr:hypothetical protein L484_009287 [Morus notabilis]
MFGRSDVQILKCSDTQMFRRSSTRIPRHSESDTRTLRYSNAWISPMPDPLVFKLRSSHVE